MHSSERTKCASCAGRIASFIRRAIFKLEEHIALPLFMTGNCDEHLSRERNRKVNQEKTQRPKDFAFPSQKKVQSFIHNLFIVENSTLCTYLKCL